MDRQQGWYPRIQLHINGVDITHVLEFKEKGTNYTNFDVILISCTLCTLECVEFGNWTYRPNKYVMDATPLKAYRLINTCETVLGYTKDCTCFILSETYFRIYNEKMVSYTYTNETNIGSVHTEQWMDVDWTPRATSLNIHLIGASPGDLSNIVIGSNDYSYLHGAYCGILQGDAKEIYGLTSIPTTSSLVLPSAPIISRYDPGVAIYKVILIGDASSCDETQVR